MQINKIGIVCPAKIDFKFCQQILGLEKLDSDIDRKVVQRKLNGIEVIAIKAGIGKINCASAAQWMIDNYKLDLIIDSGRAGALSESIKIPSVVAVLKSFEYDLLQDQELDNINEKHISQTIINNKGNNIFDNYINSEEGLIKGNIASGEKNVNNTIFRDLLAMKLDAVACSWETSAVLKVAEYCDIESLSFRCMTNWADDDSLEDDKRNRRNGLDLLYEVVGNFITSL